ncbi:nucleoside-binding protein [Treponema bryantii]|uniref:Nucleoside-binding protein n=1 Tax=Treponema bryantii TaxID=163 RepID=A0A1H9DK48_9SPIR|nr:BMP family ABC transporter substrate-binding protein [Treponema bryantii]BDC91984.1 membrane protein [Treponema bryantii]SEQ13880.1 nucleoside-binding protein [Treponema bryantii]
MKKLIAIAMMMALVCSSTFAAKAKKAKKSSKASIKIAMVTDSGDITDQSFNQTTYQACKDYAEANGLEFQYYKPAGDSNADRVASIDAAYQDGYNVIVLPGYLFGEAIGKVAKDYDDAKFIGLDISEGDLGGIAVPANVFCAVYAEELPGFFAGYAAVKEGYRHLGFLGGMAVPAVVRYGYGFVQGANKAAEELKVADQVTIEYVYGGQFYGDQTITAAMDGWYKNRGVEVVFACGGAIWSSACEAASKVGGKVIGVDVDQTAQINSYADGMCVTSAMKGLSATVNAALSAIQAGNWADYSGKIANLGLVSGKDLSLNYVGLPTDTWTMKNYSVNDYKKLVADVYANKVTVSNAIDKAPAVTVKVNYYQNIK